MNGYLLTPDLQRQIVSSIRSGCYGHVAAEAWGVPRRVFGRWLRRGLGPRATEPYAGFAAEVRSARAMARLRAEVIAYQKDAKAWLEHGPGRERPGNPGWTGSVRPAAGDAPGPAANPFLNRDFMETCKFLLDVLRPFPQARTCLAEALASRGIHHQEQREDQRRAS